jgi:spore maturation protein CgeB
MADGDRTTIGEPVDPAHGSTLDQVRKTLREAEDRLHEMHGRLRDVETRYDHQVYKTEYAAWQLASSQARRWWRLGEVVFEAKRKPSRILRLPVDLMRAARSSAAMPKPPRRPEAKRAVAVQPDSGARQGGQPDGQPSEQRTAMPHLPRLPLPGGPPARPELTAAVIADEFTATALRYEWRQVEPGPADWREVMERERPDLLLVTSARFGSGDWWDGHQPGQALQDIVTWCRDQDIPAVFWHTETTENTGDPPDSGLGLEMAALFDQVFTAHAELAPRCRELLGHDRVGVLPLAAQPRIHNPVNVGTGRRGDVAFAGTYLGDACPERAEQMRTVLEPARGSGLHVYNRLPGGDPRYRFPADYDRHVVGSLPYEQMLAAYKTYKVFLNVNSAPESPTGCARRVFELSACATPVLSGPSRAVEELFAGSVPVVRTPEDTRTLLAGLLANPEVRDRQAHLAMREVFARHTFGHRVDTVLDAIGRPMPRPEPQVSVIMVTNRPAQLPHAIAQVAGQRHRRLQLVLVLHGLDLDPQVVRDKVRTEGVEDVVVLTADGSLPLGQCLNIAIDAADGDLIAKMDDDDIYGEHYLSDLIPAFSYTDAGIVGKRACYLRLLGMNATLLSSPEAEHTYNDLVRGGTLVARGDVLRELRFDHVPRGSDTKLLRRADEAGIRIYSGDRFNYIYIRGADPSAHTWQVSDAALLKSAPVVFYGPPEQHVCI